MNRYLKVNASRLACIAALLLAAIVGWLPAEAAVLSIPFLIGNFETVAGSILSVTTTVPSSYTQGGYSNSSQGYQAVGEITDLGSGYGRQYNVVSHAPISSAQVTEKKGGYKLNAIELTLAWDMADGGQDILRTASLDNSILTFELRMQSGQKLYFTAQVSKMVVNFGTVDNVVVGMVTLLPQRDILFDPA